MRYYAIIDYNKLWGTSIFNYIIPHFWFPYPKRQYFQGFLGYFFCFRTVKVYRKRILKFFCIFSKMCNFCIDFYE